VLQDHDLDINLCSGRNYCTDTFVKIPFPPLGLAKCILGFRERMLDKLVEKLLQNAASIYMPKFQRIAYIKSINMLQ
jgi:hypothetical protein